MRRCAVQRWAVLCWAVLGWLGLHPSPVSASLRQILPWPILACPLAGSRQCVLCLGRACRRPHEFKIRCLEDIRSLFPPGKCSM